MKKTKPRRVFPIWTARAALPGVGFCGHQHSNRAAARNCAANQAQHTRRPWIVVQVRSDTNETQEILVNPS